MIYLASPPPLPARPPPLRCPSLHTCYPGRFLLTWPLGLPASPEFPKTFQELLHCPSLQDWVSFLPPCLQAGVVPCSPWGATRGHRTPVPPPGRATDPCGGALLVGDPFGRPEAPQPQSSSPLLPPASPGLPRPEGWRRADRFPLGWPGAVSLPGRAVFTGRPSPAPTAGHAVCIGAGPSRNPRGAWLGCAAEGLPLREPRCGGAWGRG